MESDIYVRIEKLERIIETLETKIDEENKKKERTV